MIPEYKRDKKTPLNMEEVLEGMPDIANLIAMVVTPLELSPSAEKKLSELIHYVPHLCLPQPQSKVQASCES